MKPETLADTYKRLAAESRGAAGSYGSKAAGMLYAHGILCNWDLGTHPAACNIEELAQHFTALAAAAGREALEFEDHLLSDSGRIERLGVLVELAKGFPEVEESSFPDSMREGL